MHKKKSNAKRLNGYRNTKSSLSEMNCLHKIHLENVFFFLVRFYFNMRLPNSVRAESVQNDVHTMVVDTIWKLQLQLISPAQRKWTAKKNEIEIVELLAMCILYDSNCGQLIQHTHTHQNERTIKKPAVQFDLIN